MLLYTVANYNILSTHDLSPQLKEYSVCNTKRYLRVHVQLLLTYLSKTFSWSTLSSRGGRHSTIASASERCILGGGRGEIVGWGVQSTSIHDDLIQNMAVKLLTSWLEFLLRTENLNTWQMSIGHTLKLNWFDYKQCLAIHTVIQFEQNTIAICGDIKRVCSREFHLFMHLLHMCTSVHSCSQYQACPLQGCEWSIIHSVLE